MDIFDFLTAKNDNVYTGSYYSRRPKTTSDVAQEFNYDLVDDHTKDKANVLNALETDSERLTIKTVDTLRFKVKGYVATQEGDFWQIESITTRPIEEFKESNRLFKNLKKETTLRLVKVENPWELR